jgi:galactokinase/mevalonate kinase-like predicted kinase
LLEQAAQLGACGGKINGSGGGGTAFAVFPDDRRQPAVEAFRAAGVRVIPINLGAEGVRIEVN